jgi:ribonuclease D
MIITTTSDLSAHCEKWRKNAFITVDTEFLREKTYWPILCLIQVGDDSGAVAIDPLAPGMDLAPFFEVMQDQNVLKVFHAARQDIEIFVKLSGKVPHPIIDTQVAAMVCGFGEQVSYETLVNALTKNIIDKTQRFTDWSRRPLSAKQIDYALSDVIHLRPIYSELKERAEKSGRWSWIQEEVGVLSNPKTYSSEPYEMWERIRSRTNNPKFLAIVRELAAWREITAQAKDLPRGRVLKDEQLLELASDPPTSEDDYKKYRNFGSGLANQFGKAVFACVQKALALSPDQWPKIELKRGLPPAKAALLELLKVLLRVKSEEQGVAAKLIASSDDLEKITLNQDDGVPALLGWRRQVFGDDAILLRDGKLALSVDKRGLKTVPVA